MSPLAALYLPLLAIVCGLHLQVHGAQNLFTMNHLMYPGQVCEKTRDYETKYFETKMDHFSFSNTQTFSLKYLINTKYWDCDHGPILFYPGNEGSIDVFSENTGFIWDIAEELNAAVVFAEHRFYGDSVWLGKNLPEGSQKMALLTVEQALEDFVDLVWFLWNGSNPGDASNVMNPGKNPVIAIGGSYGGMLAAWLRMKYPATFQGAIASSAPLFGFPELTDCYSLFKILSSIYTSTCDECGKSIKASWDAIECLTKTVDGRKWLSDNWKLCCPLYNSNDVEELESWLFKVYLYTAMANYPYPANFVGPLPGNPVKKLCEPLTDHTLDDKKLLLLLFNGISIYFNYTGQSTCLDVKYSFTTDSDHAAWSYQCCTELVIPECSEGEDDIFPESPWSYEYYSKSCFAKFNVYPDFNIMKKTYGGKNLTAATNIIFSNGLLDPWHGRGVLKDISNTVRAVLIEDAAHHLDLRGSNANDPESVIKARNFHKFMIKQWINEFYSNSLKSN